MKKIIFFWRHYQVILACVVLIFLLSLLSAASCRKEFATVDDTTDLNFFTTMLKEEIISDSICRQKDLEFIEKPLCFCVKFSQLNGIAIWAIMRAEFFK